jgi:hypothetical protein
VSKVICATCGKEMRLAETIAGKAWLCDNKKCDLQIPISQEEELKT